MHGIIFSLLLFKYIEKSVYSYWQCFGFSSLSSILLLISIMIYVFYMHHIC
jgi:hypothetical protein